jgi:hypothetical protein
MSRLERDVECARNIVAAKREVFGEGGGTLVNIGAGDPWPANDFYLDGWSCLLVDPDPQIVSSLCEHESRGDDPRWTVLSAAVSDASGVSEMHLGVPNTTSLDPTWHRNVVKQRTRAIVLVRTTTPSELVSMAPAYFQDPERSALIVDAEGMDVRILDAWPWDLFSPKLVVAETRRCHSVLFNRTYRLLRSDEVNTMWVVKDRLS